MTSVVKPWLVLTIIFVAGVATGVALTLALSPRFMHPPGEAQMRERWMTHFIRQLDLTADQQAKIRPIVADATTQIQALHHEEIDRGSKIIASMDDKIAAILTPGQKTELQGMEKDMESEREKKFSGHMHSHEGPGHYFDDRSGGDDNVPPPPPNGTNGSPPSEPPPPQNH